MKGFIFGGSADASTPEELKRKRMLAEALLARSSGRAPQNVGEGLAAIGQALAGRIALSRAGAAERAGADSANAAFMEAMSGGGAVPPVAASVSDATPTGGHSSFIQSMLPEALKASEATGVDPRIIVAQAALESGYGKHAPGNNFFGIKSHGKPGGQTLGTNEVLNGQNVRVRDSFRTYSGMPDSVQGYANFITENPRYENFRNASGLEAQAAALQASGYATDPRYGQKVLSIAQGIELPSAYAPSAGAAPPQVAAPGFEAPAPSAVPPISVANAFEAVPADAQAAAKLNIARQLQAAPQASVPQPAMRPAAPQAALADSGFPQNYQFGPEMPVPQGAPDQNILSALFNRVPDAPRDAMQGIPQLGGGSTPAPAQGTTGPSSAPASVRANSAANPYGIDPSLLRAMNNPFLSKGQQAVIGALIERQIGRQFDDPTESQLKKVQLETAKTKLEDLRNPKPDTLGKIPQGYEMFTDPATGERRLRALPGSPDAVEAADKAKSKEAATAAKGRTAAIVNADIDRALAMIENSPLSTTGLGGQILSNVPGTTARDVAGLIDTVKANAGFDALQAMRDASPTGGALGQVSEREIDFLQATIGNLEQSQSKGQLVRNLKRVKQVYADIVSGGKIKDGSFKFTDDTTERKRIRIDSEGNLLND